MARKILLADDSVTAQNMGRKILADAGYEVITVNNGSAALKKIGEQKPDLIDADYNLGRAKMALNDDQGALELLKRATTRNSDAETIQLAWYQLGIVYRRLKRNDEARNAMAEYQKLKDAEAVDLQQRMQRYTGQQNVQSGEAPVKPLEPNP